jgi:hypothetical protein
MKRRSIFQSALALLGLSKLSAASTDKVRIEGAFIPPNKPAPIWPDDLTFDVARELRRNGQNCVLVHGPVTQHGGKPVYLYSRKLHVRVNREALSDAEAWYGPLPKSLHGDLHRELVRAVATDLNMNAGAHGKSILLWRIHTCPEIDPNKLTPFDRYVADYALV